MIFLRTHAFYIICGVAAAAGVALGVTGLRAMPRVLGEMDRAVKAYQDLDSLSRKPVNEKSIQMEQERIDATMSDYEKIMAQAKDLIHYQPLTPKTLPVGEERARREFKRQYPQAMQDLFDSLHAGQPATDLQIAEMKDKIDDERASTSDKSDWGSGPDRTEAGVLTRHGARLDKRARANMAAAQRIYCYATPYQAMPMEAERGHPRSLEKKVTSLDYDPIMMDLAAVEAPTPDDVWRAQVSYWIQKDAVNAIAAINGERAAEARDKGEETWVGIMPVKEVISIRVAIDNVLPGGEAFDGADPGGYEYALPPNSAATAFTQMASNELFEVRQFTLKLIMEQRDIPRLIERLCDKTFHVPLRVAYRTQPPNKDMEGKIYGDGAVVNVVMDFETLMLGEVFRPMMPPSVCEYLKSEGYGIVCPEIEEPAEEGAEEDNG